MSPSPSPTRNLWRAIAVIAAAMSIASGGCSSTTETGSSRDCSPGETRTCACSGGENGSQLCSSDGFWRTCACSGCPVTPDCTGKACGADDGCGNACLVGSCPSGQKCNKGTCSSATCVPDCAGKMCGDPDLCGGICTSAPCAKTGYTCNAGKCECKPVCTKCGADDTCGGKCTTGACDAGFKCSAGACAVDPASKWVITITKGTIPVDKNWDSFSKPDAMVCLWIGGQRVCTQDSGDSLSPSWGCAFPAVTAATLMSGIDAETFDNDRSSPGSCGDVLTTAPGEAICSKGKVTALTSDFTSRTWGAGCADMSFEATLTPM